MIDQLSRDRHQGIHFLALLILGAILAGAAELPYGGWIQIPILSIVWWWLKQEKFASIKKMFVSGLIFGLGYFVIGLWWIYISLHDVGGMNAALSCMAVFLLSAYMAIYFSLATLTISLLHQSRLTGLFLAASWVIMEFLRGYIFTGFPWMGLAEGQLNGPFAPIAPYFGGLACTFLVIWTSWQILQIKKHAVMSVVSIAALITLSQAASLITFTKPFGEPITVRLIQGNFEQSLKFKPVSIVCPV